MSEEEFALPTKKFVKEIENFQKTGIPRCPKCKENLIKVEEQSSEYHSVWKPNCKCSSKDLRLCIG